MKIHVSVPLQRKRLRRQIRERMTADILPPGISKKTIKRIQEATVKAFLRADGYLAQGSTCNVATLSDHNFYVKVDIDSGSVAVFWKIV